MAQIGKDYYEDLTAEKLRELIARFSNGEVPVPGPQNGRYAAEPLSGLTTLKEFESGRKQFNASAQLAVDIRDTVKRIDGTEVALTTPWLGKAAKSAAKPIKVEAPKAAAPKPAKASDSAAKAPTVAKAAKPAKADEAVVAGGKQPKGLKAAKKGKADDLQIIEGIGPVLEKLLHELGIFHFDQIAQWGAAEIAWIDANLKGFRGRATRDKWVAQAKLIGEVGTQEFLIRAKTNNY
jgi:NADH-quinone oxidoreductase subunit E